MDKRKQSERKRERLRELKREKKREKKRVRKRERKREKEVEEKVKINVANYLLTVPKFVNDSFISLSGMHVRLVWEDSPDEKGEIRNHKGNKSILGHVRTGSQIFTST